MGRLVYISHPDVDVDPSVPVPQWGLNDRGHQRARAMLTQPWVAGVSQIITSPETKARQTAAILGDHCRLMPTVIEATHEVDRTSTGYVHHERHEALATALFAEPERSAGGWERAIDARDRVSAALSSVLSVKTEGTVAVVGHGGVGTLLMTNLLGESIDRRLDQPGQGHYWSYDLDAQRVRHKWRPIDAIEPTIEGSSPRPQDVVALLTAHLDFANATSPPGHVHALDLHGLSAPDISFFAARRARGQLVGVGALRELGEDRAEIKSMHTTSTARGEGLGRLMLEHLLTIARTNGCRWVGLETGAMEAFSPARRLYTSAGFAECDPFGAYTRNEHSVCMSLALPV